MPKELISQRGQLLGRIAAKVLSLEELLEEGHYDLAVTYDFSQGLSNACQNFRVPYYAWVYDSPLMGLYSKEALHEVNFISVFDRKQYDRLKPLGLKHLFYLPLAPEIDNFGAVHIGKRDEKKYTCDVSFVGRLYNNRGFEEIFEDDGVCVVEWPHYIEEQLPKERLRIEIRRIDEEVRLFIIEGIGKAYEEIERALA